MSSYPFASYVETLKMQRNDCAKKWFMSLKKKTNFSLTVQSQVHHPMPSVQNQPL